METLELVDQYIDNQLLQSQVQQLEKDLQEDAALQNLLDSVIIARKAIQLSALTSRVKELHEQYIVDIRHEPDNVFVMPVRRSYQWLPRIAATILLGLIGYGGYEYVTLEPANMYIDKFIAYKLPTPRGQYEARSTLNSLYVSGNYAAVIQVFNTLQTKMPIDYFLTGIAHLQQKDYQRAITTFSSLRHYNRQHAQTYFADESDYYLALAYLGENRLDEAQALFETIHNTPHHLFRESVSRLDLIKLGLLQLKP